LWLGHDTFTEDLHIEFLPPNIITEEIAHTWMRQLEMFKNNGHVLEIGTIHDRLPVGKVLKSGGPITDDQKYLGEVNLQINEMMYRIILHFPVDSISYNWLLDRASDKLRLHNSSIDLAADIHNNARHTAPKKYTSPIVLQYKQLDGQLANVTEDFPHDTDGGWREFFAGVFYLLD
jgi:hypothetical protein